MRKIITLLFVLSVSQVACADMLAYEGFDYTAGAGALNGSNGGFGFADVWSADANVVPDSLTTVSGFGMTSAGGAFEWGTGLGTNHSRRLNFSIPCEPAVEQVYYMSLLFKFIDNTEDGGGEWIQFAGFNNTSGSGMVWAGKGSGDEFYTEFGGTSDTSGGSVFRSNNTYLWVVKVTVRPGDDTISIMYYGAGEDTIRDEPKEDMWDCTLNKAWPDDMDKIALKMGSNTDKIYFDEIRIGESWEDVVNNTFTYASIPNVPFDRGLIMQIDGDHVWTAYEADMTKRVFTTINQAKDNITFSGKGPGIIPEIQDNALNGHPIFDYDGDDYLHCAARSYMGNFPMMTAFVVLRPDVITSAGVIMRSAYDDIDGAGKDGDLMTLYVENSKLYAQWRTVTGGGRAGSYDITGMEGQWMISNFWWDGWKIWHQLNGPSATHSADNATGMPNGHLKSRLGCHVHSTAAPFDGAIAEILIYNRVLTRDQQSIVGAYLSEKYGLTNDYPAVVVNDCEDYVRNYGSEPADWNQDCQIDGYDMLGLVSDWLDSPLD